MILYLYPFNLNYCTGHTLEQGAMAGSKQLNLPLLSLLTKWRTRSTTVTAIINARQMMRITSRREKEHLDFFPYMVGALRKQKGACGQGRWDSHDVGLMPPRAGHCTLKELVMVCVPHPSVRAGSSSNKDGKWRFIFRSA